MIKREKYLNKIIPFIDKPLIKALIGVRRSGKTVLLTQIKDYLIDRGLEEKQILYINFESFAFKKFLNGSYLYEYVIEKSNALNGQKNLSFFLTKYKTLTNGKRFSPLSLWI